MGTTITARGPEMVPGVPRPAVRIRSGVRALGVCVVASGAALAATAALEEPFRGVSFLAPLAAVVVVALHAGLGWALVAVLATTAGLQYEFLEPRGSLEVARREELLRLVGYATTALLVAWAASRARASRRFAQAERLRMEAVAGSERRARELLERIQRVTASCSAATTVEEVARAVMTQGLEHLGTSAVYLCMPDEHGDFHVAFRHGIPDDVERVFPSIAPDGPLPTSECARTRAPLFLATPAEIGRRFPAAADACGRFGVQALGVVPLCAAGELHGVLGFAFGAPRALQGEEREYVGALADEVAQAIARARSYEAEQRARQEAERLGRVKERLLAIVGHDLRTPLSSILMGASALRRRGELGAEQLGTVDRIERSARRMNAITHDILDFSRFRQGLGMTVSYAVTDAGEVARRVIAELEAASPPARIELRVEGDVSLEADPERLAQACSNLVGNAVQHGAGSRVRVEVLAAPDHVLLRFRNGGPPIDPDLVPHLFEPFRRGDRPDRTGSIGLGLFIVREIARAHAGDVEVASSERDGTTFTLRLPRRRVAASA